MQRQNMREHFVRIAKEMIVHDGVDSVSARKIADIANCSYTTMYNYFRNMNDLLWHVVASLLQDMYDEFQDIESQEDFDTGDLKILCRRYFEFFSSTPHIFTFFFFHDIGLPPPELAESVSPPFIVHLAMRILEKTMGGASREKITAYCDLITESLHGKMLFVFSNKETLPLQEVLNSIDTMIDLILHLHTGGA